MGWFALRAQADKMSALRKAGATNISLLTERRPKPADDRP